MKSEKRKVGHRYAAERLRQQTSVQRYGEADDRPEHYREAKHEQLIAAARNTAQASTLESTRQDA
jgi:hypothetical protein